jgi:hypothetical protein
VVHSTEIRTKDSKENFWEKVWNEAGDFIDWFEDWIAPLKDEKGWDLNGYYGDNLTAEWDIDLNFEWNDGNPSIDFDEAEVEFKIPLDW